MDDSTPGTDDVLSVGVTLLAALGLTIAGFGVETAAAADILAGELTVGVWEVLFGGVLIYAGAYLLGYRRLLANVPDGAEA